MELQQLTDESLHEKLQSLVRQERELLTVILHHLREVEARRLFSTHKCASLFEYCVRKLGYPEDQANRRISAMRLMKELPEIEAKIEDGSLSLTNLTQARTLFRAEAKLAAPLSKAAKLEILEKLENKSERGGSSNVDLAFGVELFTFSVRADLAHQCTELGVAGWDVAAKEAILETAEESAVSAELNGELGGATILEQAIGPFKQRIVHGVPLTSDEAGHLAKARYRERARRFITGTGLADGNPKLRVGTFVTLSNLGKLFDGKYYIVRATHTYDLTNGYRTEFDVERPGIGSG